MMVSIWVTNTTDMLMLVSFHTVAHRLTVFKVRSLEPWNPKAGKRCQARRWTRLITLTPFTGNLWSHI